MELSKKVEEAEKARGFSIKWQDLYFNVEGDERIRRAYFSEQPAFPFKDCKLSRELESYFNGERVEFECEFELSLSEFTKKVLERVLEIPYGETLTYLELAKKLNTSPRAVGQALRRNPIALLIPCHRVVAKNGIGGYSWGVEIKKDLLRLEGFKLF